MSLKIEYIARRCLNIARSTSSEQAFLRRRLVAKVHLYWVDKVLHLVRRSVCLSLAYVSLEIVMP